MKLLFTLFYIVTSLIANAQIESPRDFEKIEKKLSKIVTQLDSIKPTQINKLLEDLLDSPTLKNELENLNTELNKVNINDIFKEFKDIINTIDLKEIKGELNKGLNELNKGDNSINKKLSETLKNLFNFNDSNATNLKIKST